MPERFLTFDCAGDALAGILHEPEHDARDIGVLIIVGGPQYRVGSHRQFVLMARNLCAEGYPVLRFDYRGMGDSSGAARSFEHVDDDIGSALAALRSAHPAVRRVICIGLCDAASAALIFCNTTGSVGGLVLINPWARTEGGQAAVVVRHYYARRLLQRSFWSKFFSARINSMSAVSELFATIRRAATGNRQGQANAVEHFLGRMARGFGSFDGPALFLMSDRDLTAREFERLCTDSADWAAMMGRPSVSCVRIMNADHTFSSRESLEQARRAIVEWLGGL